MFVQTFPIHTEDKQQLRRIDPMVQEWIADLGGDGLCVLTASHTTAGLCITNHKDPASALDVVHEIDRLIPTRVDFHHILDTPRDAAGHVKTALVGASLTIPYVAGRLRLGSAQGIFFCEFDGPRQREVSAHVVPSGVEELPSAPSIPPA